MRRLTPTLRSFVTHTSHLAALLGTAVLAMAAAPMAVNDAASDVPTGVRPEAPPVTAVAEPAGPVTRQITFEKPLKGFVVNSAFGLRKLAGARGRMHKGDDMAAPRGTSV